MCRAEAEHVKFPRDIDDAKQLGLVLSRYKDKYYLQVCVSSHLSTFPLKGVRCF
jgi:hypothetical protein